MLIKIIQLFSGIYFKIIIYLVIGKEKRFFMMENILFTAAFVPGVVGVYTKS